MSVVSAVTVETVTENALEQANQMLAAGDKTGALRTVATALTDSRSRVWVRNHDELIRKFFDLCLSERKESSIRDVLASYQRLTSQAQEAGAKAFEDAIMYLMQNARQVVEVNAVTPANLAAANTWALLSGEPVSAYLARQHDDLVHLFTSIVHHCVSRTTHDFKYELLFQKIITYSFNFCRDFNRPSELSIYSDLLKKHHEKAMSKPEHATAVMNHADTIDAVSFTKILQLEVAAALKLWRIAASSLEETAKFFDEVKSQSKAIKKHLWIPFYEVLAKLFLEVDQSTLHCACLVKLARLCFSKDTNDRSMAIVASRAVLSIISVPVTAGNPGLALSHDSSREKLVTLERYLYLTVPPTRASLAQELSVGRGSIPPICDFAFPEVRALFSMLFEVSTVDVCQKVEPYLQKIAAIPELAVYVPSLQNAAVQSMLFVMSRCIERLSIPHLLAMIPFFSAKDYTSRLEPLLLNAIGSAQLSIDMSTNSVRFIATNHQNVLGAMGALADQLAVAVDACYKHQSTQVKRAPSKTKEGPLSGKSLLERMALERQRIQDKQELVEARLDCEEKRRDAEKKRDEDRRQAEIDRLRQMEAERNEARRQEADELLARQIADLRAIEQRKWCITVLHQRHPELVLDMKLAKLSATGFKEEVTKQLTQFIKEKAYRKSAGLRDREHMERAMREAEIPRLLDSAEKSKESPEVREERLSKRAEQARKDHEAALQIKQRLSLIDSVRRRYENSVKARIESQESAKTSKRDRQEEDLRREKERIEAEAKAEAEKEAAAAKASSPTAPAPSSAPLGGGKGAWKPGSKR